jgi:hypothetical protein
LDPCTLLSTGRAIVHMTSPQKPSNPTASSVGTRYCRTKNVDDVSQVQIDQKQRAGKLGGLAPAVLKPCDMTVVHLSRSCHVLPKHFYNIARTCARFNSIFQNKDNIPLTISGSPLLRNFCHRQGLNWSTPPSHKGLTAESMT